MREILRRRWVLGTAVLVVVLAVGVAALLIIRARSTEPWPTTPVKHDACAVIRPGDFGAFRGVRPLTDLFDNHGGGPELVQRSVEPMETSGELGDSCVYSSRFDNGSPRFEVAVGPTMKELPDLPNMREIIGPQLGHDSVQYISQDDENSVMVTVLEEDASIEVSAIGFPKGLRGEGSKWSSGVNDLARMQAITLTEAVVKRLGWNTLPLMIAEGVCRRPDNATVETALGKKPTFSRSVNRDDYDHCAYTADNGTKLTARVERGRPNSTRPPHRQGWDELDGAPNTYQHDNQIAVTDPKHQTVAYLQVTSRDGQTQDREPQDLATIGKQLLTDSDGS